MSSKQRPREDNVIYANFGAKTRVTQVQPQDAEIRHVHGDTLAQSFLRSIYLDQTDSGRISRGKAYAHGNVVSFRVQRDRLIADVAGSQLEPFNVNVVFPRRGPVELEEVTAELLGTPGALAAARQGVLTPSLVELLLASDTSDVRVMCDCPDNTLCCKHGVAVVEYFANRISTDPKLIFELRGLNFTQLELSMQQAAQEMASEKADEQDGFWEGGQLPALPHPKVAPAIDESDLDALHKAMRTVSYTSVDELRAVADIEELYDFLVDR